ncbi:MAG: YbgF trimerization domain-containing protein [Spongiibacteraceae bacterium]
MRLQNKSSLAKWLTLSSALCLSAALASAQAPIIDATQSAGTSRAKPSTGAPTNQSSATGDLLIQLQSLQQEVMELRGIVEEQNHQIETLKQQSLDRYNDLDKRIGQPHASATPAAATEPAPIDANATPVAPETHAPAAVVVPTPAPAVAAPATMETAKPEEYEAYQVAYAKLRSQDFNGAIKGFTAFLSQYPNSSLAGNSYFWLGKSYLLVQPQDLNKAQVAFTKVGEHPQSNKVPDALYELGKVYFLKGDKPRAKTLLQQVIDNYGASGSNAPQLAKQFLDQNFPAAKR